MVRGVLDGHALDERGGGAAEAQVDDPRAVVDRVDDPERLVHVGERARLRARLDDEELRGAAEARDPVAVRARARGDRGHERAVAFRISHVRAARVDVVPGRRLRGEIRRGEVGARVHDRDRQRAGGAQDRGRHRVGVGRPVLPFEREAVREAGREAGLCAGDAGGDRLDRPDPGTARDPGREPQRRSLRHDLGDVEGGDPADDGAVDVREGDRQRPLRRIADREPWRRR